jgi:TATA-binding protein-associated factor Taf7
MEELKSFFGFNDDEDEEEEEEDEKGNENVRERKLMADFNIEESCDDA